MSSNNEMPLLMVVNHTRGEKVMMSPWDDMVSLDTVFGIGTIMKWEVGKDKDNITFGTRESFDDCDYALYDKQGRVVYTPAVDGDGDDGSDDEDWATEDEDESSSSSDDDDDAADDEAPIDEMNKLKVGNKRTSEEAEIDYEYEEVEVEAK